MKNIKVGLLPLYLELYDDVVPDKRKSVEKFSAKIKNEIEKHGISIDAAPVCRLKKEFAKEIRKFEENSVEAIVTLHLAYSPSLESIDALAGTNLPVIILDTTPDCDFGFESSSDKIFANHGIHGVQDMCNLLIRRNKKFAIEVGHWQKSNVIDRVVANIKACSAASTMRNARVGIIGNQFKGMGDFAIPFSDLKKHIGFDVIKSSAAEFKAFKHSENEIKKEIASYEKLFSIKGKSVKGIRETAKTSLSVRKWIEKEELTAFSFNFMDVDKNCGLETVPFVEASLAMARGTGYAGEGDVMTAAFAASLASVFPETSFTEMFCPDWSGNKVFMSHMGEVNVGLLIGKPELIEKDLPFLKSSVPPFMPYGCLKSGNAAILNLAPGPDNTFTLIACAGKMKAPKKALMDAISGWFEPEIPVAEFLKEYSLYGGTHHSVLVYEPDYEIISQYAELMNWSYALV